MTLAALLAEHVELCQRASGAAAALSDLVGSCPEHPVILQGDDCAGCAPIVAAAIEHQRLAQQANLAHERIHLERAAERSRAELATLNPPPAERRGRFEALNLAPRVVALIIVVRTAAAVGLFTIGLWLGRVVR